MTLFHIQAQLKHTEGSVMISKAISLWIWTQFKDMCSLCIRCFFPAPELELCESDSVLARDLAFNDVTPESVWWNFAQPFMARIKGFYARFKAWRLYFLTISIIIQNNTTVITIDTWKPFLLSLSLHLSTETFLFKVVFLIMTPVCF